MQFEISWQQLVFAEQAAAAEDVAAVLLAPDFHLQRQLQNLVYC